MAQHTAGTHGARGRMAGRLAAGLLGLVLGGTGLAVAQYGRPYDLPPADPGYDTYYHDGAATADRARHWGYHDGFVDGRRDREHGHSFRPTQDDHYKDAPDHGDHHGMSRQQYKDLYRDAYVHGYERGYGQDYDRDRDRDRDFDRDRYR